MGLIDFWISRYHQFMSKRSIGRDKRQQEHILTEEINRIFNETKTKIPLVRNYRKKIKVPLAHALQELSAMITRIPGPLELDPDMWEKEPLFNIVFSGTDQFHQWLRNYKNLQDAFGQTDVDELFGLLVVNYKEKTLFGSEIDGDLIRRDIPQQMVYFEEPRILVPSAGIETARKELQHRIIVMLLTRELDKIADLTSWKEELQQQQELLEFKLGGDVKADEENLAAFDKTENDDTQHVLSHISRKIEEIEAVADTPEAHLTHVINAIKAIQQHLQMNPFTLRLNSLGKKVKASSSESFNEIQLTECTFTGAKKKAVIWVRVKRSSMN